MNQLVSIGAGSSLLSSEDKKEELEYRYKPRQGPLITPEPEFYDVEQSDELFDVDPNTTLLVSAKENLDDILKDMQRSIEVEYDSISNEKFSEILNSKRHIRPLEFQELTQTCVQKFLASSDLYVGQILTKNVIDLLDSLLSSMRESLVICKRKIAQKLVNIRDSLASHKSSVRLAFEHEKSEAIRITRNESMREFLNELNYLREHSEKLDYGNRILTKKIDWFTGELSKKDAQINALEAKSLKAAKKVVHIVSLPFVDYLILSVMSDSVVD